MLLPRKFLAYLIVPRPKAILEVRQYQNRSFLRVTGETVASRSMLVFPPRMFTLSTKCCLNGRVSYPTSCANSQVLFRPWALRTQSASRPAKQFSCCLRPGFSALPLSLRRLHLVQESLQEVGARRNLKLLSSILVRMES